MDKQRLFTNEIAFIGLGNIFDKGLGIHAVYHIKQIYGNNFIYLFEHEKNLMDIFLEINKNFRIHFIIFVVAVNINRLQNKFIWIKDPNDVNFTNRTHQLALSLYRKMLLNSKKEVYILGIQRSIVNDNQAMSERVFFNLKLKTIINNKIDNLRDYQKQKQ